MATPQDVLRSFKLKLTVPRLSILELFSLADDHHLTADQIYRKLQRNGNKLAMATIYRVLAQFVTSGVLIKHKFAKEAVYELADVPHHDHLVCLNCNKVVEFEDDLIEQRQLQVAASHNFKMTDHVLTIYGICRVCQHLDI